MATNEIWKPVVGFEGLYEASNTGKVRSLDRVIECENRWGTITKYTRRGKVMGHFLLDEARGDAQCVRLSKYGKPQTKYLKRLVYEAFHGSIGVEKAHIIHKDGDNFNCHISNLILKNEVNND